MTCGAIDAARFRTRTPPASSTRCQELPAASRFERFALISTGPHCSG